MSNSRMITAAALALITLGLALACGDDGTGPARIDRVVISTLDGDTTPEVRKGDVLRLRAQAFRGSTQVTVSRFRWNSESPQIATVDSTGLVRGLAFGTAQITAEPVEQAGVVGRAALAVVGPPVATVQVLPADTFVDIADTVQFVAVGRDAGGTTLSDVEFTWRATAANVTVNLLGQAIGQTPGIAQIEATAWNNVKGTARARVTPVTGISPDTGRYGSIVAVQGTELPAGAQVFFNGSGNTRVRAFTRSASTSRIDVWVPVGAASGPLRLVAPSDSFGTSREFRLTRADDVFEDVNDTAFVLLPVPYNNPSLVARRQDFDFYAFQTQQAAPLSFFLAHRGGREISNSAVGILFFVNPIRVAAFITPVDFISGQPLDSAVWSRASLPPGTYGLSIAHVRWSQSDTTTVRPYGLTLTPASTFGLAPDAFEPNDFPRESQRVTLSFDQSGLNAENPYAIDNYVFTLSQRSSVHASVAATTSDVDLFILRGDTLDVWQTDPNPFLDTTLVAARSFTPEFTDSVTVTLAPGTYTAVVHEFAGRPTSYRLRISATASSAAGEPVSRAGTQDPGPVKRRLMELLQVTRGLGGSSSFTETVENGRSSRRHRFVLRLGQ
ncbi:MAG: Ig-like domain-containing protein [Gemmatimonadetes bacterium]|nr:Ig-like domain-containing protein [Gemmatimonadota bacterium]